MRGPVFKENDIILKMVFSHTVDISYAGTSTFFYLILSEPKGTNGYWNALKMTSGGVHGIYQYDLNFFKGVAPYTVLLNGVDFHNV